MTSSPHLKRAPVVSSVSHGQQYRPTEINSRISWNITNPFKNHLATQPPPKSAFLPFVPDFIISTISVLLCMAYIYRERPRVAEEGKPVPPQPAKSTRSAVPFYFRWTQHVSWVISCLISLITMAVFWLGIVSFGMLQYPPSRTLELYTVQSSKNIGK